MEPAPLPRKYRRAFAWSVRFASIRTLSSASATRAVCAVIGDFRPAHGRLALIPPEIGLSLVGSSLPLIDRGVSMAATAAGGDKYLLCGLCVGGGGGGMCCMVCILNYVF